MFKCMELSVELDLPSANFISWFAWSRRYVIEYSEKIKEDVNKEVQMGWSVRFKVISDSADLIVLHHFVLRSLVSITSFGTL